MARTYGEDNIGLLQSLWIQVLDRPTRRLSIVALGLLLLVWMLGSPSLVSACVGLGGYISEKLLGGAGATSASLHLGDSTDGPAVLGSSPTIATLGVNDSASAGGVTTATLRGNLINLNGMPQADVWFVWGYNSSMGNTTSVDTVTTTGEKTTVLSGATAGREVFYQFQASTDGTSEGVMQSFIAGGGHGTSYWLLETLLPIIIALALFVTVLMLTGNPIAALIGAVIGLLTFLFVQEAVKVLF